MIWSKWKGQSVQTHKDKATWISTVDPLYGICPADLAQDPGRPGGQYCRLTSSCYFELFIVLILKKN